MRSSRPPRRERLQVAGGGTLAPGRWRNARTQRTDLDPITLRGELGTAPRVPRLALQGALRFLTKETA
ncbi:uncharacterized protein SOCEGT47_021680 [Sorangium cellulosum]|uniref:Uncharacterized protein n=1 Tax=Sorangium cellulosum TaxID=56 RepID=A0A4P2PYC3_SORCE|nr:uncharacterized protein SOCEGT47_021680 [Sorangium cellulosum]